MSDKEHLKDTLTAQKKRLKRVAVEYLFVVFIFLILAVIVIIVALIEDKEYSNRVVYIVIPIVALFCVFFLLLSIKRFMLLNAYKQARYENEVAIDIDCKSIRFITYARTKFFIDILGIIFVDANSQKYTYILPDELSDSTGIRKMIRQAYTGKIVKSVCYTGTKMIKRFPNDILK